MEVSLLCMMATSEHWVFQDFFQSPEGFFFKTFGGLGHVISTRLCWTRLASLLNRKLCMTWFFSWTVVLHERHSISLKFQTSTISLVCGHLFPFLVYHFERTRNFIPNLNRLCNIPSLVIRIRLASQPVCPIPYLTLPRVKHQKFCTVNLEALSSIMKWEKWQW